MLGYIYVTDTFYFNVCFILTDIFKNNNLKYAFK